MTTAFAEKRVSFYVANKNCHIKKIVRVDEMPHKM